MENEENTRKMENEKTLEIENNKKVNKTKRIRKEEKNDTYDNGEPRENRKKQERTRENLGEKRMRRCEGTMEYKKERQQRKENEGRLRNVWEVNFSSHRAICPPRNIS